MKNIYIKSRLSIIAGFLLSFIIFTGMFLLNDNIAKADSYCSSNGATMSLAQFRAAQSAGKITYSIGASGSSVVASITNNTSCSFPATLDAFKVFGDTLSEQRLFTNSSVTVAPNSTANLDVTFATCMTQVDLYYGNGPGSTPNNEGGALITWTYVNNNGVGWGSASKSGMLCSDNPPAPTPTPTPTPTPNLTASCSVSPSSANVGDSISWGATATGGTGSYNYSWTGTDSLSGNSSSVYKNYDSAGTKLGTVTITSGSQSVTRTCQTVIQSVVVQNDLQASCSASPSSANINDSVAWSATATGGTGSYNYSWTGTDSLSGNSSSVYKNYDSAGTKLGTVTITSGSQSVTRTCQTVIQSVVVQNDLYVSCSASPSTVDTDEDVTWYANASGGNSSYSYDWSGTDNLDGSSRNVTWSYSDSGTKRATVTVTSDGHTVSASCTARVIDTENTNDNLSVSCYASPSTVQTGTRMYWYVNVSGGDGDYSYDWLGTNGLNSSSRSPAMTYSSTGQKSATITVRDGNGNRDSDTCYLNVNQSNTVLAYTDSYQQPLASAVYLSQVPYTGVADNMKLYLFIGILAFLSAWITYIVISYKKESGELN